MISKEICERVLQKASSTGADYAELFAENTLNHAVNLVGGKVDSVHDSQIAGAAVRVFLGLRSVMATTVDTTESGLLRCAQRAAEALAEGKAEISISLRERLFGDIHPIRIVPASVANADKAALLKDACSAASEYDAAVVQVTGTLLDVDRRILVATSEGLWTQDRQIRTRMMVSAVAEVNGETQTGGCRPGARTGMELFEKVDPRAIGREAARQAVTMAGAGYCPAGVMPVAIGNGFGGVIFHEACGHSLEATGVAPEKTAAFEEKFEEAFGAGAVNPRNLVNTKEFVVKTPSVTIKAAPECAGLIEPRRINGRQYILVQVDGEVEFNGVTVCFDPPEEAPPLGPLPDRPAPAEESGPLPQDEVSQSDENGPLPQGGDSLPEQPEEGADNQSDEKGDEEA